MTGALWIGVKPAPPLSALAAAIRRICARVGVETERRKFVPHITLARFGGAGAFREQIAPWLRSVGVIVDQGVVVRVACTSCLSIFDVDTRAILEKRGRDFSLIDARPSCKISTCRGRGVFVAARSVRDPFVTMLGAGGDPCGLDGRRPIDFEPPEPTPAIAAVA